MSYKVGDKVRTIKDRDLNGTKLFPKGTIGVITHIDYDDRLPYMVYDLENNCIYYYSEDMLEPYNEKTYSDGLADAWELVKHILDFPREDWYNIFRIEDCFMIDILTDNTYQQALAKIEAYEKEKAIKVGDVVECFSDYKGVVLNRISEQIDVFTENGCVECLVTNDAKKTNKHLDIEHLLEQIRGNE